ncbi:MAG: CPBP family intramembrane glutamic endopeptidase [Nocardioidaceae bacterium]
MSERAWHRLRTTVEAWLPMPITHVVPVRHQESAAVVRRRRWVVGGTSLLGAGLLGVSLSARPGSTRFYVTTLATAGTWVVGGVLSGPLHLGWIESRDQRLRRPAVVPVATGAAAFTFFYGCALVARRIPFLDRAIGRVLAFAEQGSGPLVLLSTCANGLGEEVFFRGAMYAALPHDRAVLGSTGVYVATTVATRNPSLVLAATVMGGLFALQRRASGGLQAPLLTHLTWSTLMIRYLPPLFRKAHDGQPPSAEDIG